MSRRSWTDEQLIEECKTSVSYASVMRKLGLKPGGGSNRLVKDRAVKIYLSGPSSPTGKRQSGLNPEG